MRGPDTSAMANQQRRGIDSSDIVHQIYVKVVDSSIDPDTKSKQFTLELLKFVHQHLGEFKQMGVSTKVNKIKSADLRNPRLIEAMKRRGITSLPAVVTPNNVYVGLKTIFDLYSRNLKEHVAIAGRGVATPEGAVMEDEDLFRKYYGAEMTLEKALDDTEDVSVGDSGKDMMTSYREFMASREKMAANRPQPRVTPTRQEPGPRAAPPRAGSRPGPQAGPRPGPQAAPRPAPPRGENVPPPKATDPDDEEFLNMIDELSRDIDDNTRKQAFSSTTGDSNDEEGTNDPRDDLIMNSWLANQVPSER